MDQTQFGIASSQNSLPSLADCCGIDRDRLLDDLLGNRVALLFVELNVLGVPHLRLRAGRDELRVEVLDDVAGRQDVAGS